MYGLTVWLGAISCLLFAGESNANCVKVKGQ